MCGYGILCAGAAIYLYNRTKRGTILLDEYTTETRAVVERAFEKYRIKGVRYGKEDIACNIEFKQPSFYRYLAAHVKFLNY